MSISVNSHLNQESRTTMKLQEGTCEGHDPYKVLTIGDVTIFMDPTQLKALTVLLQGHAKFGDDREIEVISEKALEQYSSEHANLEEQKMHDEAINAAFEGN